MKQYILTISAILFLSIFARGEENVSGHISGTILDEETNEPIEFVSVAIFSENENNLITGTITEPDGSFNIKGITSGEYYVEVSFIGYEKFVVDEIEIASGKAKIDLGKIILPRAVEQLDEVEIVADEMSVEYKIDRKVISRSLRKSKKWDFVKI